MDKLNILILATGYYPAKTYGGPVSSIQNLAMLLKDDCRFYVVTRNHELHDSKRLEGIRDGWCTRDECEIIYLDDSKMNVSGIVEASRASGVDFSVVFSQFFLTTASILPEGRYQRSSISPSLLHLAARFVPARSISSAGRKFPTPPFGNDFMTEAELIIS